MSLIIDKKGRRMTDNRIDEKDIIKSFPKVHLTVWARLHNLPVQRVFCLGCKKTVLVSRPFMIEHPKTKAAVVGLTTTQNGEHSCAEGFGVDIAKMVSDKELNIEDDGGLL